MRIIYCISSISGGGAERQLSYLASRLAQMGVETHIIYLTEGPSPPDFKSRNVCLHQIPHRNNYDPKILIFLYRLFKELQPDLIHTCIVQMDILAGFVAKILRIPWVLREASSEFAASERGKKEFWRRCVAYFLDHAVANSKSGYEYWQKSLGKANCSLIYNGLPKHIFFPIDTVTNHDEVNTVFLFAGRLVAHKNIFLLLKAFSRISNDHNVRLKVCGTGVQKNNILTFIKSHHLEDKIECLGHVDQSQLLKLMRSCHLLINPSFYEGSPNVVLEAMASGCTVAVSSIPAHLDILRENSAYFFEVQDISSLEAVLLKIISNKQDALDKAKRAKKIAEMFTLEKMVGSYFCLYKKIIDNKGGF